MRLCRKLHFFPKVNSLPSFQATCIDTCPGWIMKLCYIVTLEVCLAHSTDPILVVLKRCTGEKSALEDQGPKPTFL